MKTTTTTIEHSQSSQKTQHRIQELEHQDDAPLSQPNNSNSHSQELNGSTDRSALDSLATAASGSTCQDVASSCTPVASTTPQGPGRIQTHENFSAPSSVPQESNSTTTSKPHESEHHSYIISSPGTLTYLNDAYTYDDQTNIVPSQACEMSGTEDVAYGSASYDHLNQDDRGLQFASPWDMDLSFDLIDWMTEENILMADEMVIPDTLVNRDEFDARGMTPVSQNQNLPSMAAFNGSTLPRPSMPAIQTHGNIIAENRQLHLPPASTMPDRAQGPVSPLTPNTTFDTRSIEPAATQWPVDWDPAKVDNLVSFPDMSGIPRDFYESEDFALVPRLGVKTYEDIDGSLRQTSQDQTIWRHFQNAVLPPRHAMDCFVQLYFEYFQPIFPLLHQPSFDPNSTSWVLVLAIAAVGCLYSNTPESGKCANALQELLRRAIMLVCERDNSSARKIWLTQAILLNGIGMTYCGNRRLLELALAFQSSSVTQSRRNGSLKQPAQLVSIDQTTEGAELESKWRAWIHEESFRRLGFCVWLYDGQFSLYFDICPVMRISEMRQQLPCHEVVWDASHASAWKEAFLRYQTPFNQPLYLHSTLESLYTSPSLSMRLGGFAKLIVVFSIFRNVWDMQQYASTPFLPALSLLSQGEWIEKVKSALQYIERSSRGSFANTDMVQLSLEAHTHLVSLMLYIPLAEVLMYARSQKGNRDGQQARKRLENWTREMNGRTARHAVIHASALFGLIRTRLCGSFYEPITFLIATLTLWTFSQFSPNQLASSPSDSSGHYNNMGQLQSRIRLDKIRSAEGAQEWIENGGDMGGYLANVGNICVAASGARILKIATQTLSSMDTWALGTGFASVLAQLQSEEPGQA
ncbi:hypothetical protein VE03_06892 [Pseudogymnoascus sp. 23342-1-I1]|nr:hypothetical protein VE03_06892 [Pseudogymnoascus sp. 23342-1-I1]